MKKICHPGVSPGNCLLTKKSEDSGYGADHPGSPSEVSARIFLSLQATPSILLDVNKLKGVLFCTQQL